MALDRRIVELYDEYIHKPLDRHSFMNRLIAIAGSVAATEAALALPEPNYAQARQVAPDDARLETKPIGETHNGVRFRGYLVTPRAAAKRGGVLVIHAFHNDASADRYDAAAARLAWERTVAFLAAETGAA